MYLLLSLLIVSVFSVSLPEQVKQHPSHSSFLKWSNKHGHTYKTSEEIFHRFENFQASVKRIEEANRDSTVVFALNKFSGLSPKEFKEQYLMKNFIATPEEEREYLDIPDVEAPSAFDWRTHGKVTKVKNQEQCGSCWAFSVVENIESVWMLAKGISNTSMESLSPQQIVDCDGTDAGCSGGDTPTAYKYVIKSGGLDSEKSYPYKASDGSCKFKKNEIGAKISSWKYAAGKKQEEQMKSSLSSIAPLSICLDAENWQDYSTGVMSAKKCAKHVSLDHCVQAVGYDSTANPPYWIVRNSWGEGWGESGYIRLEYGQNTCGLTDEVTTAIA